MKNVRLEVGLVDGDTLQLAIVQESQEHPLGWVTMDAVDLSRHIDNVSELRSLMSDPVPPSLDPGSRLTPTFQPAWWVDKATTDGGVSGTLLALRHPGKGWIGFLLDTEGARQLGQALLRYTSEQ